MIKMRRARERWRERFINYKIYIEYIKWWFQFLCLRKYLISSYTLYNTYIFYSINHYKTKCMLYFIWIVCKQRINMNKKKKCKKYYIAHSSILQIEFIYISLWTVRFYLASDSKRVTFLFENYRLTHIHYFKNVRMQLHISLLRIGVCMCVLNINAYNAIFLPHQLHAKSFT